MKKNISYFTEMTSEEEFNLIQKIADRALDMGIADDHISAMMDLTVANKVFDLRLEELLSSDSFYFAHDVAGIIKNINRETCSFNSLFVPRFAS